MYDSRVAKTLWLQLINPGESCAIFLGVEPAIKVIYTCTKNITCTQGMMSKVKRLVTNLATAFTEQI